MDLHGGHHWIMGEHFRLFTKHYMKLLLKWKLKVKKSHLVL